MNYDKRERRSAIYDLKRRSGEPLDWYTNQGSSFDTVTGKTEYSWKVIKVRKAIVLPNQMDRAFKFSLSYLAANKNFIYGGEFDKSLIQVIIDLRDLPRDFQNREVNQSDKICLNGKVYQIRSIEIFDGLIFYVEMRHVVGQQPDAIYNEFVQNDLGGNDV